MLKRAVGLIVLFLLVINIVNAAKIDKTIEEKLESEDEVSVIVVLNDDYSSVNELSVNSAKNKNLINERLMVEKQQDKVLKNLNYKKISLKNESIGKKTLSKTSKKINDEEKKDFWLKHKYKAINGFSGEITKEGLEKLKNNPDVKRVYINGVKNIFLDASVPLVNATRTWSLVYNNSNLTGAGETICVIDTGVNYNHTNLGAGWGNKIIEGYNTLDGSTNNICSVNNSACYDDHGHGTHVIGTIISNHSTYKGVAPDAKIVAIKACNSGGSCTDDDVIAGIDLCINNATNLNISVISMSLGGGLYSSYCNDDSIANSINTAVGENISVVIAAGNGLNNDGVGSSTQIASPACVQNATPISATNDNDAIASFSDRAPNFGVLLFAPGVDIISLNYGGGTTSKSGTSMSTPHAAGAFALINQYRRLEGSRKLTPTEIEYSLNDTGKAITDGSTTYRRINIFAAILSLDTIAPSITFVNPENNSIKTNLSFIVNITSNEVLANATLEVNNTNFTMAGSGTKWNLNVSSLVNGTYIYKIYGNDTFGNKGVSQTFTINIDLIPPYWSNNITNISDINNIRKHEVIQFNVTWNDAADLSSFIFSWNDTGTWDNFTNGSLNGKTQIVSVNKTITTAKGSVIGYKFYANDSVNNLNETDTWTFSIANTIPVAANITLNSSDFLNRTNGTLEGSFSFTDVDGDMITANETRWYNNSEEVLELINHTMTTSNYTKKNQIWTFSARVHDGFDWSNWINSTNLTIKNTPPQINITTTNIELNETQLVNISLNASDMDNAGMNFTINSTLFSLINNQFLWYPNLSQSGNYNFNVTVNDTEATDSIIIGITVIDVRDADNDGNPDFNDTDDDNDGISDENDFLLGNLSSVNTTNINISIKINSSTNLTKIVYS